MREAGSTPNATIAVSAAAMFGGASFVGVAEELVPGGPSAPLLPAVVAIGLALLLVLGRTWVNRRMLAFVAPLGAALIATSLAQTTVAGDGAVLYMLPVVWVSHFYGRRETAAMVVWIGVAHGLALHAMAPGLGNADRWLDVMVSVVVVALTIRALTERHDRLVTQTRAEARTDVLSGLANRRAFNEDFPRIVARARIDAEALTIVSFDIDHFKRINDTHGHDAGDLVIASIGRILRSRARPGDLLARMGGEEFVAVLCGMDVHAGTAFADRIRAAVSQSDDDGLPAATLSAGVATAADGGSTPQAVLAAADATLYLAKRGGRNQTEARQLTDARGLATAA
jgi:diguanylate cyclase (GGDEF)-like protein